MANEIPEICPLEGKKEKSSTVKCVCCCYLRQVKWPHPGFWYCAADRMERGLPDYESAP